MDVSNSCINTCLFSDVSMYFNNDITATAEAPIVKTISSLRIILAKANNTATNNVDKSALAGFFL